MTRAQWREQVERDLKGADYERRLVKVRDQGIRVEPLYTDEDWSGQGDPGGVAGLGSLRRGATALGSSREGWISLLRHDHPDPARLNARLLEDLGRGADGALVRLGRGGLDASDPGSLAAALADVRPGEAWLAFEGGADEACAVLGWLDGALPEGTPARVSLGLDPLGALAGDGALAESLDEALAGLGRLMVEATTRPGVRAARVDTGVYHHAGADEAQDLAFGLATALAYLRAGEAAGLSVEEAAAQIEFCLRLDTAFFMGLARLRAGRVLWSRVLRACGVEAPGCWQRVEPSLRSLTKRDPWVNMLRNTACVFAGAVGGADAVVSTPFDATLGQPDALGRRVARNTPLILAEEGHLHRVVDPAGGSWFIESLTDRLAEAAWEIFKKIEGLGGMGAALGGGHIQAWIAEVAQARDRDVARRKRALIGVSLFPNLGEEAPAAEVVTRPEVAERAAGGARVEPLRPRPLAEGFEALRDRSDLRLATTGARPRVLSLNLGTIAQHTARATFARNLLEAGGLEVVDHHAADGVDAPTLAEALATSGATLAVVCGSDDTYQERAGATFEALAAAGARRAILAGHPGPREAAWRQAGMTDFLHLGCDALALLQGLWDAIDQPADQGGAA